MLFDLTASDTSPLSLSEQDVAALAACGRGTILLDRKSTRLNSSH